MKRWIANDRFRAIGPTDIWISPFPQYPVEDLPFEGTPLNELPLRMGARSLQMLKSVRPGDISLQTMRRKRHLKTILDQLHKYGPRDYKGAWVEFILNLCCTHFCTLTFSRDLTKDKDLAYKLVREFSKRLNRLLLGRNFAKSTKREDSALVIAFSDTGSDEKTSRKLRRQQKSRQIKRHIRFGKDQALHFHLLIRLTEDHLSLLENKQLEIAKEIPGMWADLGQTFATRNGELEHTANYCGSSLIEPIENPLAVTLYCLKNIQPLPVGTHQVTPPDSLSDPTTQFETEDMAS